MPPHAQQGFSTNCRFGLHRHPITTSVYIHGRQHCARTCRCALAPPVLASAPSLALAATAGWGLRGEQRRTSQPGRPLAQVPAAAAARSTASTAGSERPSPG